MEVLNNEIKDLLHLSLKTSKVIASFLSELDAKILSVGQPEGENETTIQISEHKKLLDDIIYRSGVDIRNLTEYKDFLTLLRQYLVSAPVIKLELPFEASDEFSEQLFEWFRKSAFGHFFIQTKVNMEIGAGVHVSWKGNFINLDLENVLEGRFLENKDVFEEILRR
ncbi:hypothetical protein JXA34_00270 [Patescibacteria group bacterium]|nr:hypothetical protein [Patescibacteria group bacterium]